MYSVRKDTSLVSKPQRKEMSLNLIINCLQAHVVGGRTEGWSGWKDNRK